MAKKSGAHQRDWKWPGDGVPNSVSSRADLGELPLKGIRSVTGNSPPYSVRSYRVRDLHVGTSDERRSWFYATSVHILVRRPGFDLLFDKTGVENPILQIVSSCHQNTESEGARTTPRAISAEYNPTYSQSISQINIMLKSHAASIAM